MILIDQSREFSVDEDNAVDFLRGFHLVEILPTEVIPDECEKARTQVYDSAFQFEEDGLKTLREALPKRKHFKLNCKPLLAWQKKQCGFIRHSFGFSDNRQSRKAFKKAGFIVGKLSGIVQLQTRMEGV